MPIEFTLNGAPKTVDAPPEMPLLWVLRDVLDMKGTKFGCGRNFCGACTVHVDGVAERSCRLPLSRAAGKKITTIEGLSADGTHPVQLAWKEIDVPQCGYCQAGQIMAATALLATNPKPDDAAIDEAMSDNLCRCATYTRVRAAIHKAVEIAAAGPGGAGKSTESTSGRGGE